MAGTSWPSCAAFQPTEQTESVAEHDAERNHSDWLFDQTNQCKRRKKEKTEQAPQAGRPLD